MSDISRIPCGMFLDWLQIAELYSVNCKPYEDTVKPLYTDIGYNDKIRCNDNLNEMIPKLKMRQIIRGSIKLQETHVVDIC